MIETFWSLLVVFSPILISVAVARGAEWALPDKPPNGDILRWAHSAALYLTGTVLLFLVVPAGHAGVVAWTDVEAFGLLRQVALPVAVSVVIGVLALDLAEWIAHFLLHRIPALWRIHRVHHSDEDLDVVTGFRFHPIEMVLRYLVGLTMIALMGIGPTAILTYWALALAFNTWEHANVRMPGLLRPLHHLVITPELHRVHHSNRPEHHHSNFGVLMSCWDLAFGSKVLPDGPLEYGLGDSVTSSERDTLAGLLAQPFRAGRRQSPTGRARQR